MTTGHYFPFTPNQRYPDPRIEVIDDDFMKYRLLSSTVEQIFSGLRWAEGPVWFGDGRYLLVSDIPNNRILRWDETDGSVSEFRRPSNHANGHARDRKGRLLSCEHLTRRVTRTEYDGRVTVLADRFDGKRLNSPNDIVCQSNGAIWFTDPPFGILGLWEGEPAARELPDAVYRIDPRDGKLTKVIDDLDAPNGLAFSPDESILYVVESRARPHRLIWAYDVRSDGTLASKRLYISAQGHGGLDGIAVDVDGNVWCGWGHNGARDADGEELDGVRVFDRAGKPLARIALPARCANLCFGGARNNCLFMASCHSVFTVYVNVRGAV